MERSYQQLIGDVLFWHSVHFDAKGFAREIATTPLTLESLRGKSRIKRITAARRDVARMLRSREENRELGQRVFSMTRIGSILNRHHTTIVAYLYRKIRYDSPNQKHIHRTLSAFENRPGPHLS